MEQIERIREMEDALDQAAAAAAELSAVLAQYHIALEQIRKLDDYYGSGLWYEDVQADESGALPKDLKRGVLSEDGIWNLLSENHDLAIEMLETATETLKK